MLICDLDKIETSLLSHFLDLVEESDEDKNGKIDFGEWEVMGKFSLSSYPVSDLLRMKKKKSQKDQGTRTYGRRSSCTSQRTLSTI